MKIYIIKHTKGLSLKLIYDELSRGGRIVAYAYCISIIAKTFRLISTPHYIRPKEMLSKYSRPYTLLTLFLGWWGLPWGPVYTHEMLLANSKNGGGVDITQDILIKIKKQYADANSQAILTEDLTIEFDDDEMI